MEKEIKHNIRSQIVTIGQLRTGQYHLDDDKYGVAAYVLTKERKKACLDCPFNTSEDNPALYLEVVDDVIAGRNQMFGTRIKVNDEVIPCGTGSSLEVEKVYRKLGLGASIMMFFTRNSGYDYYLASGISDEALPLYERLKYHVLPFPRIMFLNNSRCILESKGLKGGLLKLSTAIVNVFLLYFKNNNRKVASKISKQFTLRLENKVPEWVDEITLHDNHKYMEVHDHKWFQWNLENNFHGLPQDKQWFYGIYKDNEPIGFFMTKQRYRETAGGAIHNVVIGSIMEWGTKNESILSETEIYKLAFSTFDRNVDIIETATANNDAVKQMKKSGFIPHGKAHIAFKDNTKKFKDASDINLWRVRYGYADVILT